MKSKNATNLYAKMLEHQRLVRQFAAGQNVTPEQLEESNKQMLWAAAQVRVDNQTVDNQTVDIPL